MRQQEGELGPVRLTLPPSKVWNLEWYQNYFCAELKQETLDQLTLLGRNCRGDLQRRFAVSSPCSRNLPCPSTKLSAILVKTTVSRESRTFHWDGTLGGTLFSYFTQTLPTFLDPGVIPCLTLSTANVLRIAYVGYPELDLTVGGKSGYQQGVVDSQRQLYGHPN